MIEEEKKRHAATLERLDREFDEAVKEEQKKEAEAKEQLEKMKTEYTQAVLKLDEGVATRVAESVASKTVNTACLFGWLLARLKGR